MRLSQFSLTRRWRSAENYDDNSCHDSQTQQQEGRKHKSRQREALQENNRTTNWSEQSRKAISYRLLTPLCHETKTKKPRQPNNINRVTHITKSLTVIFCLQYFILCRALMCCHFAIYCIGK